MTEAPKGPSAVDRIGQGVSFVAKLFTTVLWGFAVVGGFAIGSPLVSVVAIAYLAYIWLFGGRWLIY
jgi:hypothetical protein